MRPTLRGSGNGASHPRKSSWPPRSMGEGPFVRVRESESESERVSERVRKRNEGEDAGVTHACFFARHFVATQGVPNLL